ncbi:MAG: hypothetical protein ACKV2Q_24735 [Planctomycetaceae bacterium]
MRAFQPGITWSTTHNPFDGEQGRALYVSPAGEADGSAIDYRHLRGISPSSQLIGGAFPAIGDGPLGLDAHIALAKADDPLEWTLPAEYEDATFVINVRPHAAGLELPTLFGFQVVETVAGLVSAGVIGTVIVISTTKLDGGGVRIAFRYFASVVGNQPESFDLRDLSESLATVTVPAKTTHDYTVTITGLADATLYTFAIVAITAAGETELATLDVTGDDSGPDVSGELTLTPL